MRSAKVKVLITTILSLLIICGLGLGGCLVGWWLSWEYSIGRLTHWTSMGKPPGNATEIVALKPNWAERTVTVYVKTATGKIYKRSTGDIEGWVETSVPQNLTYGEGGCLDKVPVPVLEVLPGKAIDCSRMIWNWEWFADEVYLVVAEDGTVWRWHLYTGYDRFARFVCTSSVAGVCAGLGISKLLQRLWRRQ